MSIDWGVVWNGAVDVAERSVHARAPAASRHVRPIVEARRERLKRLMLAWADGALDEAVLERELKEERGIVESELRAVRAMAKSAAHDAAGAMFRVIDDALVDGIDLP
jgi:hypothetical protein